MATFHPFPLLPPELRIKIWRLSWVPRLVKPHRKLVDHICDPADQRLHQADVNSPFRRLNTHYECCEDLRQDHTAAILSDWKGSFQNYYFSISTKADRDEDRQVFCTITTSQAELPATLWVSQESRDLTLQSYELCWGLDGGETHIYFNFKLDALSLERDTAWLRYHERDLVRLQTAVLSTGDIHHYSTFADEALRSTSKLKKGCVFSIPTESGFVMPNLLYSPVASIAHTFPALSRVISLQGLNTLNGGPTGEENAQLMDPLVIRYNIADKLLRIQQGNHEANDPIMVQLVATFPSRNSRTCWPVDFSFARVAEQPEALEVVDEEASRRAEAARLKDPEYALVHQIAWQWVVEVVYELEYPLDPEIDEKATMALEM